MKTWKITGTKWGKPIVVTVKAETYERAVYKAAFRGINWTIIALQD